MANVTVVVAAFGASALLTACSCTPGVPVTGNGERDPTYGGSQSETASTVALSPAPWYQIFGPRWRETLVVTYNDDTEDGKVQYTTSDRVVFRGASLLGWSYSTNGGSTWKYGGKVKPPAGIGALWGDPAIVTSKTDRKRVYISSLAAATSRIPTSGLHGPLNGAITGACVARSDDGGVHFAIHSCFTANNDFYDGASLAAAGAPGDQRIFAAYLDVPNSRIDVWQSPDGIGAFQRLGEPFPGMRMASHPRLAYDDSTGALLVAAISSGTQLIYINRLVGNQWQTPILASWPVTRIDVPVGTQTIRTAFGFSFDVGTPSYPPPVSAGIARLRVYKDAIRLLYTTRDSSTLRLYVRGTGCARDITACEDVPQWGTTPGNFDTPGHQFNPTVKAWRGSSGFPSVWKATYQSTDDRSDRVSIKQGTLGRSPIGVPIFQPYGLMTPRIVCPDFRNGSPGQAFGGYWGDYDESAHVGFANGGVAQFLLAFSDSSQGCFSQWKFTSKHLHVRAIKFK